VKHERATEETQETAALYALGALSQFESRAFEMHLRSGCPVCENELARFEEVVGSIGTLAPPAEPPPHIRDQLLAQVEKESRIPQAGLQSQRSVESSTVVEKKKSRLSTIIPWAVAASLLVAFGYVFNQLRVEREATQARIAEARNAQTELVLAKQELLQASTQVHQLTEINNVLGAEDRKLIALQGQPVAPNASANVYWDVPNRKWVVTASLPAVPAGKTYELWFVTPDKKTIPAGLMKPDANGKGFAVISVPESVGELAAAAITLENEGGSEVPTLPIYAMGTPR
jgi:anti-sigma-K factor RskA